MYYILAMHYILALCIAYFIIAVLLFTVLKISHCNARFRKAFTDVICESYRLWVIAVYAYGISYNINSITCISDNLTFLMKAPGSVRGTNVPSSV